MSNHLSKIIRKKIRWGECVWNEDWVRNWTGIWSKWWIISRKNWVVCTTNRPRSCREQPLWTSPRRTSSWSCRDTCRTWRTGWRTPKHRYVTSDCTWVSSSGRRNRTKRSNRRRIWWSGTRRSGCRRASSRKWKWISSWRCQCRVLCGTIRSRNWGRWARSQAWSTFATSTSRCPQRE